MATYLILDCTPEVNDKEWVERELKLLGVEVELSYPNVVISELVRSRKMLKGYYVQLCQVFNILRKAKSGDTIICWYSVTGVFLNFFSRLLGNKYNLILLNWLTPASKKRPIDRLYRFVLTNPRARILINLKSTEQQWIQHLSVAGHQKAKFMFNPDVFNDSDEFVPCAIKKEKYIFIGGMSNRNWQIVNEIAKQNPTITFVCCALEVDFINQVESKASNIKTYFNLPFEDYNKLMQNASISLIPLRSNLVSGLITMLKTIQYGIPCIVTDTPATRRYVPSDKCNLLLCDDNVDNWSKSIITIMTYSDSEYRNVVNELQVYILDNFSPKKSAQVIVNATNSFN